MKKSEKYHAAMLAVLNSNLQNEVKLEVLDLLLDDKATAEWCEKRENAE